MQILLIGLCGYVLVKRRVFNADGLTQFSKLNVNILWPLFIFAQLSENFRYDLYPDWWTYPLFSIGLILISYGLARVVLTLDRSVSAKNEFAALVAFQNSGNLPLMLVTAMFTGAMMQKFYVYIFLFIIGSILMVWTFGVWLVVQHKITRDDFKKLLNPPFVATVLTLIAIQFDLHRFVPGAVMKPVNLLGNCALPLAILIVGGNMAMITLHDVRVRQTVLLVVTKLVLMPAVALAVVIGLNVPFDYGFLAIVQTAVPSAITLSLIARYYGQEGKFINQGLFYTNLVSLVTMPVFLTIYMYLKG